MVQESRVVRSLVYQNQLVVSSGMGYIVVHQGSGVTVDAVYASYDLALHCIAHLATIYPTVVFTILPL